MKITGHAIGRINGRLAGLVSEAEVQAAVNGIRFGKGQTYQQVKSLGRTVEVDGCWGDTIYAVVDTEGWQGARVVTVVLRGSCQSDRSFRPYSGLPAQHRR